MDKQEELGEQHGMQDARALAAGNGTLSTTAVIDSARQASDLYSRGYVRGFDSVK